MCVCVCVPFADVLSFQTETQLLLGDSPGIFCLHEFSCLRYFTGVDLEVSPFFFFPVFFHLTQRLAHMLTGSRISFLKKIFYYNIFKTQVFPCVCA